MDADGQEVGGLDPGSVGADEAEERAEALGDLAAMQADPGGGLEGSEPAAGSGDQAPIGAPPGTSPLGLGTLDQGATSQITGAGQPAPADDEASAP